jgi:hypothetical protein
MTPRLFRPWQRWIALSLAFPSIARAQFPSATYSRSGTLPAMITTKGAVEQFVKELAGLASSIEPIDTVNAGQMGLSTRVMTRDRRWVAGGGPISAGLDTLTARLNHASELSLVGFELRDGRSYRSRGSLFNADRVQGASITLVFSPTLEGPVNDYYVFGADRARVDQIADRIEAFGRQWATWRSPKVGEMLETALKVASLFVVALAFGLRDRRHIWLLYPASALLFATSYALTLTSLFQPFRIVAGP